MKKQIVIVAAVIFVVFGLVFVGQSYISNQSLIGRNEGIVEPTRSFDTSSQLFASATPVIEKVTIVVDFGEGKKIEGQVVGKTVYEALKNFAREKSFTVSAKQYKYGVMVEKIADRVGSSTYAWMYSVNGKAGRIAADIFTVKPNDNIEWKYQKIN